MQPLVALLHAVLHWFHVPAYGRGFSDEMNRSVSNEMNRSSTLRSPFESSMCICTSAQKRVQSAAQSVTTAGASRRIAAMQAVWKQASFFSGGPDTTDKPWGISMCHC
jgi:hypothetical protein